MSDDFVTQLQLQLREAAQRDERRSTLGRRLAQIRRGAPGSAPIVAGALAAALIAVVVIAGGLQWGGQKPVAGPRVLATLPLSGSLGSISSGFGAAWVVDKTNGQVLRVDPRSRRVRARIPVGGEVGLNVGAGAVWALESRRLLRIDPATNRVTARVPLLLPDGRPFSSVDVQIHRGVPWVVGVEGALRIDPAAGGSSTPRPSRGASLNRGTSSATTISGS